MENMDVAKAKELAQYRKGDTSHSCWNCYEAHYVKKGRKEICVCPKLGGAEVEPEQTCNHFMSPPADRYGIDRARVLPDFKIEVRFMDGEEGIVDCLDERIQAKIWPQFRDKFYDEKVFKNIDVNDPFCVSFSEAAVDIEYFELRKILGFEEGV